MRQLTLLDDALLGIAIFCALENVAFVLMIAKGWLVVALP